MPLIFYPHVDELESSTIDQKLEVLMEAAERYKAVVLDVKKNHEVVPTEKKKMTPREMGHAFNWNDLAKVLREIRELPEGNPSSKLAKSDRLLKLASVYEVLRGAKMPKLEAVRLALVNEAGQLRSGSSQVA